MEFSESNKEAYLDDLKDKESLLVRRVVYDDELDFDLFAGGRPLRYVGGMDISFLKNSNKAVSCLVVLSFPALEVVYEDVTVVDLTFPYIPGFLAYRESPSLCVLFRKLKENSPQFVPQVILLDGNGVLHPRGFGLACHVGIELDVPTIGVAKNFLHIDGLHKEDIMAHISEKTRKLPVVGSSGSTWGMAVLPPSANNRPVFVSIGHRISLKTSVEVVDACFKFRVPEPVRKADLIGRAFVKKMGGNLPNDDDDDGD